MQSIILPIERKLIESELRPKYLWRQTNKANNLVYVIRASEAPHVMQEIGRLREVAFRMAGGGTGKSVDIDELDMADDGYQQLIVWDPREREILGGYRFIIPRTEGVELSTEHYFEFSDRFRSHYLPYLIELGRSFVQPQYQAGGKALFALDNLWDGLGALVLRNPEIKYLFGKVTMYGEYNTNARNMLIYFLRKYFPDREHLLCTRYPVDIHINDTQMERLFVGSNYTEDYRILTKSIRDFEETIPPLINAYMNLSPTMKVFDTALNPDFGNVEETGILITIGDVYKAKMERHFEGCE
ncbi:MAG: GNAT family N-acetyltransferase [Mucinivorans sp.]